jgi:hypothetical protein
MAELKTKPIHATPHKIDRKNFKGMAGLSLCLKKVDFSFQFDESHVPHSTKK